LKKPALTVNKRSFLSMLCSRCRCCVCVDRHLLQFFHNTRVRANIMAATTFVVFLRHVSAHKQITHAASDASSLNRVIAGFASTACLILLLHSREVSLSNSVWTSHLISNIRCPDAFISQLDKRKSKYIVGSRGPSSERVCIHRRGMEQGLCDAVISGDWRSVKQYYSNTCACRKKRFNYHNQVKLTSSNMNLRMQCCTLQSCKHFSAETSSKALLYVTMVFHCVIQERQLRSVGQLAVFATIVRCSFSIIAQDILNSRRKKRRFCSAIAKYTSYTSECWDTQTTHTVALERMH